MQWESRSRPGERAVRAVLLVDHGSRRAEANAMLEQIAESLRMRLPDRLVRTAHLDVAEPDIAAGIDACVADGAAEIVVHPFFLGPGRHTTRDIPEQVRAAAARHPQVRVHITPPLAPHDKLIEVILDRVAEARP